MRALSVDIFDIVIDVFSDADIIVVAAGICSTELFMLAVIWVGVSDGA